MVSARCSQREGSLASHTYLVKIPYTPSLSPLSSCICFLLLVASWLLLSPVDFYLGLWVCSCFSSPGYYITLGGRVSAIFNIWLSKHPNPVGKYVASFYGSSMKWQTTFTPAFHQPVTWPKFTTAKEYCQVYYCKVYFWEKSSCELGRKKEIDLVNSYPDSTTLLSPVFSLAPSLILTFWPLHGIIQQRSVILNNFWQIEPDSGW